MVSKANQKSFKDFFKNVSVVLKAADEHLKVLQTKLPIDFFEEQPNLIGPSYIEYITEKKDFETTSVIDRLNESYYTSVYPIYHDIRLSAYILIHQLEIGSDRYVDVDRLYKFAAEFLLRESFRLNIETSGLNFPERERERTDFDDLLSQEFVKISATYTLGNTEAFYIATQNSVPLFTSSNQRSTLDEREIVPASNFSITKILPHAYRPNFNTLGNVAPNVSRQHQNTVQSEILSRFLHPNWYSLPTSKWLEESDFQTFAPSVDEQNTVVTPLDKARLWFEHVGYKLFLASHSEFELNGASQEIDIDATQDATSQEATQDNDKLNEKIEVDESIEDIGTISLENLYEWEPFNEIGEDEIEAFENGSELELVSKLLQELQQKQDERAKISIVNDKPPVEETKLYFKVKRLLREITIKADKLPDIKLSTSLPLLQTDYPGTLPVPTQNMNSKKKNKSRR